MLFIKFASLHKFAMKAAFLIILLILSTITKSFSQYIDYDYESMLLAEEKNLTGLAFKPVISFGAGAFSFYGDVNDYMRIPFNGLGSARVSISRDLGKYFDIEFHGTIGAIAGNSYNGDSTQKMNFRSSLFIGGVSAYYNFNHILKRQRPIHPYISVGIEIIQFTPKGDLYDINGNQYHYWSDGTIRNAAENPFTTANLLTRDYIYETDLRSKDIYGYGQYSKTCMGIPVDIGFNATISDRVQCRFGVATHIAMSDYIDNYKGGNKLSNDIIINTYVGLTIDLFSADDEIAAVENFRNLKFTITDKLDDDGDKVDDFNDECPGTPPGVKVNYKGCPEDSDKDGVPDYLDKQTDTPFGSFAVGANGIRIMEAQLIALLYDPDAVKRSEVKLYASKTQATSNIDTSKGIPAKFKIVDINGDNYISLEELQQAIDDFFEMKSTLTPEDINELQDFFFNQ